LHNCPEFDCIKREKEEYLILKNETFITEYNISMQARNILAPILWL